jgi:hypothetical protein
MGEPDRDSSSSGQVARVDSCIVSQPVLRLELDAHRMYA